MNILNIIESLTILRRHYDNPENARLGAYGGKFYMDETDRPLSPKDYRRLRDLGWYQTIRERDYDPNDDWQADL